MLRRSWAGPGPGALAGERAGVGVFEVTTPAGEENDSDHQAQEGENRSS